MTTVQLDYPIQCEGIEITAIQLRRLKARDIKKMESIRGTDIEKSISMIADLAELPPSAIEELDAADFTKISELVAEFLKK